MPSLGEREAKKLSWEMGPIRPPNEGGSNSLLVRVTRNCPWNKCTFCGTYNEKSFQIKKVEEIKEEIDTIKAIRDRVVENGVTPDLASKNCLSIVSRWVRQGEKTAFIQDADSLIMRTPQLVEVIEYLKETFPRLERITSYARSKTLARKSVEELRDLQEAGLTRVHVGLESGDSEVLKRVKKGVTSEEHIEGGRNTKKSGIELSEYVMPGLGGRSLSEQHAENTAEVLNEINPDFIRMRPLELKKGTEIYVEYKSGNFKPSSPHERLKEIRTMVKLLDVEGRLCFDHMRNSWRHKSGEPLFKRSYEGYKLPEEKNEVLKLIEKGLEMEESIHTHSILSNN